MHTVRVHATKMIGLSAASEMVVGVYAVYGESPEA
jgi:hypothetical protein